MKIALGAAKGLAFLHDEAHVIYRDFKTSDILLDLVCENVQLLKFVFEMSSGIVYHKL